MAAAGHTCSNCKAPLSNEPLPPPRPPTSLPEVVDDQFVVVLDALGGSDPFAETGGGGAPETAAEAIQRCLREHRRGAADDSDPVCARCCARRGEPRRRRRPPSFPRLSAPHRDERIPMQKTALALAAPATLVVTLVQVLLAV